MDEKQSENKKKGGTGAGSTVGVGTYGVQAKPQPVKLRPLEPPASTKGGDKDRQVKIKLRLDAITAERDKLKKQFETAEIEGKRLQKSLNDTKLLRSEKVDEILEENYLQDGEQKLLSKILTAKIHEPRLHQLRDNVAKLDVQCDWIKKKLASLSKEEAKLDRDLSELVIADHCADIVVGMNQIASYYKMMAKVFDKLVYDVQDLISLSERLGPDPHYSERLRRQGLKPWQITIIDSYMSKNLSRQNVLYWLVKVSQFQDDDNIFNAIGQVPREFKQPRIRDNFGTSTQGRGESQQARLNAEISKVIAQLT